MISILVLTYNEEMNLARCLDSVKWSDDVLVVDSFSTDSTVKLAKELGARVLQNPFVNFADQRNFGLIKGGLIHEWVLHVDADEVVTPELHNEMATIIQTGEKDAYRISSKMIFQGRWLKYSSLYPWYQVRLGKRDKLSFVQVGHGQREKLPSNNVGTLQESFLHYSFGKGIGDWLDRHNRYSTAEALRFLTSHDKAIDWLGLFSWYDAARRQGAFKDYFAFLPARPALRFLYMYVFKRGFLDGRAGFTYCRLLCIYEYFIVLKIRELRRRSRGLPL